jgi:endonuclease III
VRTPATDDRARTRRIVRDLDRAHPDARFELDFTTPLELLIALILAAQFRDDRVNEITPALFARYRTARDWAEAPPEQLQHDLQKVNFFRQKTKAVQRCTADLVARFGGEVPRDLDALLTLPYVGRKTANVLRGNAFDAPAIGVDRHVARLSQRIGLTAQEDPDLIEADLMQVVRPADRVRFCHLLQWHGRRVCLARTPLCEICVIQPVCDFGRSVGATKAPGRGTGAAVAVKTKVDAAGKAAVPARTGTAKPRAIPEAKAAGDATRKPRPAAKAVTTRTTRAPADRHSGRSSSSPPR